MHFHLCNKDHLCLVFVQLYCLSSRIHRVELKEQFRAAAICVLLCGAGCHQKNYDEIACEENCPTASSLPINKLQGHHNTCENRTFTYTNSKFRYCRSREDAVQKERKKCFSSGSRKLNTPEATLYNYPAATSHFRSIHSSTAENKDTIKLPELATRRAAMFKIEEFSQGRQQY